MNTGDACYIFKNIGFAEEYSTEEKIIGKTYDGRKLYQKTLVIGTPTEQRAVIPHGIANFRGIFNAFGICTRTSTGLINTIPMLYTSWEIWIYDYSAETFVLRCSDNQWNAGVQDVEVTLQYTKTTD